MSFNSQIIGLVFCGLFSFCIHTNSLHAKSSLKGSVKIDGSSTVFPISEAVAEEFNKEFPRVRVTIGVSGTGGGFKKFCSGETQINDASRLIKNKEMAKCKKNKIDYIKIPVAYDGISVIIHKKNTWAQKLTAAQLKQIWEPGSKITTWNQIDTSWPNQRIKLYGPGSDSGTFDYFTKKINGKEGASRSSYTASENDNIIIQGVSRDIYALGYVGYAYYENNLSKLQAASIDGISPTLATVKTADKTKKYPLARVIYIYVNKEAAAQPGVHKFVEFYIQNAKTLSKAVGYVPLEKKMYGDQTKKFAQSGKTAKKIIK